MNPECVRKSDPSLSSTIGFHWMVVVPSPRKIGKIVLAGAGAREDRSRADDAIVAARLVIVGPADVVEAVVAEHHVVRSEPASTGSRWP